MTECPPPATPDHYRAVFADILSQIVTGELVGAENFAALARLCTSAEDRAEAEEHAQNERSHAQAFRRAAEDLGVMIVVDLDAPYWKRIRTAFLRWAEQRDHVACTLIQEVMLESFAVSIYRAVSEVAQGALASTLRGIACEEEDHLEHAMQLLGEELQRDPAAFTAKVQRVHEDVVTVLAEMLGKKDSIGHCGLCSGTCVKDALHHVRLSVATLRGHALQSYLQALDRIGLPGERTLEWVANLPL
jgi:fatty aldehyde decarbonylase